MSTRYKITLISNGHYSTRIKNFDYLADAMCKARFIARMHNVEKYAARFIDDEQGNTLAVYNPTTNTWNIIEH